MKARFDGVFLAAAAGLAVLLAAFASNARETGKVVATKVDVYLDGHPIQEMRYAVACPASLRFSPFVRVTGPTTISSRLDYVENSSAYGPGAWQTGPESRHTFPSAGGAALRPLDFRMGSPGERRYGSVRLFVDGALRMTVPYSFQCRR